MSFEIKYDSWALITGVGNGLGAEFTHPIAARGLNVVLVDIDTAGLSCTESRIRAPSRVKGMTKNIHTIFQHSNANYNH